MRQQFDTVTISQNGFQSTHSLRSATGGNARPGVLAGFQSTHSLRSATGKSSRPVKSPEVSIHALLAECDFRVPFARSSLLISFNPRTPCGVRLFVEPWKEPFVRFQSTHSLRSATGIGFQDSGLGDVSIHALLAECDPLNRTERTSLTLFQSTHSLRSATSQVQLPHLHPFGFNPRTPCGVRPDFFRVASTM